MEVLLLLSLLVGYVVMAFVFLVSAHTASRRSRWLGFIAIAAAAPVFYWLGAFTEQASAGACYSNVVSRVASAVEQTKSPKALAAEIKSLPMRGYETSCPEVEQASHKLSGSALPDKSSKRTR
ncbi:hypothetical protein GCM10027285_12480 [Oleiagrimonas citrea]|uniref:Uncharacterized protein n=1 Tax=Oleiagrimonas citrea TaxID=1665687 RepID=A0A846ZL80_9GAMM|nr:hypothetical protein [Oleiagrimonas citrea]NKZ38191.1 hypothetical protein [Oleiagrimonas citrea]